MTAKPFNVGILVFPNITQLDMTGPFEVFSRMPGARVHLIWKDTRMLCSDTGLSFLPTTTYDNVGRLDLLCVPGGPGIGDLLEDSETLEFIRRQARTANYMTSVCTGALVLGAAGLLQGRKATTHWLSKELLEAFSATYLAQRVVVDDHLITGGGVTAGIDFALTVVAQQAGDAIAKQIQLAIEYAPAPPFDSGTPDTAAPELVALSRATAADRQAERAERVARAVASLKLQTPA